MSVVVCSGSVHTAAFLLLELMTRILCMATLPQRSVFCLSDASPLP